jgi:hypothetical protein
MPGRAATTAGMALTTGIAVMDAHRRDILQPEVGQVSRHLAANVVQRQAELVGHGLHGVGEHRGCLPHSFSVAVVAGRATPAKFVRVGVGCPQADVERLGDPQVVDLPTRAGSHSGEVLGPAGVDPAAEEAGLSAASGLLQGRPSRLATGAAGEKPAVVATLMPATSRRVRCSTSGRSGM